MSSSQIPTREEEEDAYIDAGEIDEVAKEDEDVGQPMSEDEDEGEVQDEDQDPEDYDQDDTLEIDMSNNSSTYFDTHNDSIYLIATHPTLPMVVSGGGDNMGYLWTTNSHPPKIVTQLSGHTESLVAGGFTFDGSYLVTGDMSGQIRVWKSAMRGQKWEFFGSVQEVEEVVWIRFHPKQNIFAAGSIDGSVWCYSLEPKLENISVLSSHSMPTNNGLFVNTDDMDSLSLITISDDSTIINWNVYTSSANYTLTAKELHGEHPWVSITPSPSGKSIAVGSTDGTIIIIGIEKGNLLSTVRGSFTEEMDLLEQSIEGMSWSDTTNILAVGNVAGEIQLYDAASWRVRKTLKIEDSITKLEFVPGTPYLISSGIDGSLNKWDVRSGESKWEGKGHNAGVLGFAYQKDGTRIISAGDEGVSLVFNDEPILPSAGSANRPQQLLTH